MLVNIVYIATSLDGYIATKDGGIDWLHEAPNPTGEDFGFSKFMDGIDALIMGRKTYETVLSFDTEWPYKKKVFVLSRSLKDVDIALKGKAEIINGEIKEIISRLNEKGYKNLYIDGGETVQSFLEESLIDELIITKIPIILGSGIPLFTEFKASQKFEHIETSEFSGMVKSHYKKIK